MHFDELCLEPDNAKPGSIRNIILTLCANDNIEQNWIYNEQVFFMKIFYFLLQIFFFFLDTSIRK